MLSSPEISNIAQIRVNEGLVFIWDSSQEIAMAAKTKREPSPFLVDSSELEGRRNARLKATKDLVKGIMEDGLPFSGKGTAWENDSLIKTWKSALSDLDSMSLDHYSRLQMRRDLETRIANRQERLEAGEFPAVIKL